LERKIFTFGIERWFARPCHGEDRQAGRGNPGFDVAWHGWTGGLPNVEGEFADGALPIIMLTARSEEIDKVLGLEIGAMIT